MEVPSACHCHELCIQYAGVGCRSYKFEVGNRPRTFAEKIAAIRKDMGCANADPSGCPCDPDGVGLASYSCPSADDTLWESDGQMCVKLYPDMDQDWNKWPEGYDYPADYGLGCKVHIEPGSYHC